MFLGLGKSKQIAEQTDQQSLLLQDSLRSSDVVNAYVQVSEIGFIKLGGTHVKATHKHENLNILLTVQYQDTILDLKKKIGERIEQTEKRFNNLTNLRASYLNKKGSDQALIDTDLAVDVLEDNDEIEFDLESNDLWLHIVLTLFTGKELMVYGSAEMRVDKRELLSSLKVKLQVMVIDMWTEMFRQYDSLYVIESIDLFVDEDVLENMKKRNDDGS